MAISDAKKEVTYQRAYHESKGKVFSSCTEGAMQGQAYGEQVRESVGHLGDIARELVVGL